MFPLLCIAAGVLFGSAVYLMMQGSLARLLVGLSLLTPAANVFIFGVGGLLPHRAPILGPGEAAPTGVVADPLPQALILTAIVIGLGVQFFFLVLLQKAYALSNSDWVDDWRASDE